MKIQIRKGVFETNSSSTHAISIAAWKDDITIPNSIMFDSSGTFGWEHYTHSDTYTKAQYLWVSACSDYQYLENEDKLLEIRAKLTEILNDAGVENVVFDMPRYVKSKWSDEDEYFLDMNGYIDHSGDISGFAEELIDNPEMLLSYLFNSNSVIETGNDNSDYQPEIREDAVMSFYKGN